MAEESNNVENVENAVKVSTVESGNNTEQDEEK